MKAQTQEFDAKVEKQAEEIESLRKMAADTTQSPSTNDSILELFCMGWKINYGWNV